MQKDVRFFDIKEGMPVKEREEFHNRELRRIVKYAYNNSPPMRAKFERVGAKPSDIQNLKGLGKIPVTPKEELRRLQKDTPPFGGLVGLPINKLSRIFVSPGPIYDVEGPRRRGNEVIAFYSLGFRPGDIVMNSFSYHFVRAGWSMDKGLSQLGCVVIASGVGNTELQVQVMHDLRVTGFSGTPSFLMMLIKKAESMGYNFHNDFSLKIAYLSAEPVPPSMKKVFEEEYGINAGESYGTAELGLLGYGCPAKSGMHVPEEIILEIVDPATGKQLPSGDMGEVVITSLDKTLPIIRIGTGDLSYYTDEPCLCGRTSPRLVRIAGRVGNVVKVRGMFIQPKQVEELVASLPEICDFQMVVSRNGPRDDLIFKVAVEESCKNPSGVCEELGNKFQDICRVKIDSIQIVPKGSLSKESKRMVDNRNWD